MAMNAPEAEEMVAGCKKAGVKLMVAYRQQYEPNNRKIREMIAEKTFGRIKLFDGVITQNQDGSGKEAINQWRHKKALAGGGALPDIGLYCLNGVRYLTGEEPEEVFGTMSSTKGDPRFSEVEENFVWQMRFPSGLIANCQTGYGAYTSKYFRFNAENGWFGMDPAYKYNGNKLHVASADGNVENRATPSVAEVNQFAAEMDHMADCVREKKEPMSPGEEGVQDHRIMDALYESARTRKPISLAKIEKRDSFRHPKSLV
jgi:predicted dehydrogenase